MYVMRRKDGSAKNLGLVSTAGVLVRMRMYYQIKWRINHFKERIFCTVASVQATYSSANVVMNLLFDSYKGQAMFT